MNPAGAVWLLMTFLTLPALCSGQSATARLHCESLRFYRGSANDYAGFRWTIDLTTLPSGINNELALDFFDSGYTHSSYVDVDSRLYDETAPGAMVLNVPYAGDANGNGFDDFFEVSQPANGLTSSGVLQCGGFGINSTLQASWHRDAGSASGVCILTLPDPANPFVNISFRHTFDLIEYIGVVSYTPGVSNVSCVLLTTNALTDDVLNGPLVFEKSKTDPQNELTLLSLSLTNSSLQELGLYAQSSLYRDLDYPTNYYGWVEFNDGDLNTAQEDYFSWLLSIDDTHDSDQDGIPDFSDDPSTTPPAAPILGVMLGTNNVWITIHGEVGRLIKIESAETLLTTNWTVVHSVTLTNNPQTESLPRPETTTFWRAQMPSSP